MIIIQNTYSRTSSGSNEAVELLTSGKLRPEEESEEKWVRCRKCSCKIALLTDKININHTNLHIFKNPSGIIFRIICFSNAPGSINISNYTEENTWFKGYLWSISICRACNNHLGWHYNSGNEEFYGLIADRLIGI